MLSVPMNIVISMYDSIANPYYRGGGAIAMHEIGKRLAGKGHTVVFVCGAYHGSQNKVVDGISYEHIGPAFGPKLAQIFFCLCVPWHVVKRRGTFDVWLECGAILGALGLPLLTKKPVVFMGENMPARDMQAKYHLPVAWIDRLMFRFFYNHAIVVSAEMKDYLCPSK